MLKKVGQNLEKMKYNSDAPGRPDMPQFDPDKGGPKFDQIESDLEAGNLNIAPPYKQTTEGKVIKTYENFINKWKKGQI